MAIDPYKYFRVEGRELVEELVKGVLDLEKPARAPEMVPRLLRLAHTLKGAARVVRQREIADCAHAIEDALGPFRNDGPAVPREQVDTILELIDSIGARVAGLAAPGVAPADPATTAAPDGLYRTLAADVRDIDDLLEGVAEAHAQLATLRLRVATLEKLHRLSDELVDELRSPRARHPQGVLPGGTLSLAERLRDGVAGLDASVAPAMMRVDREVRQVRETAERLRLLPAELMFNALERAIRDAAQSLGKRVVLETKGGDVRLDVQLLGSIQRGLVQIVRNAVAHGIEPEAERAAAGKPREGRISLEIDRRGNRVCFRCRDDGRGVDVEAVRRAAQRLGALPAGTGALGPDQLIGLLMTGGVTTSRSVTEVAGRGIGLDIVRETAIRLGGEVAVRSEPGKGATFELTVPASLSSVDALIVEAGGRAAAIPLGAVRRTVRLVAVDVARTGDGASILFEGKPIPFAPLAPALGGADGAPPTWSVVVLESRGSVAAIGVDRLRGTQHIVLRQLPRMTPADAVLAGASLDADGTPQMVLDPDELVALARRFKAEAPPTPAPRLPILVIDDSLTTRMLEQSILESAGYTVDLATSGEEALDKARRTKYALFLVDVEMPGMDGFTFLSQARADTELRQVPGVLVTSRNSPEDRQRGAAAGARGYILKSEFDQNELLAQIRTLVA
jgi:two-component system, chemotaxis family, sensor kinase CheA